MQELLQSAGVTAKCRSYCKVQELLQSAGVTGRTRKFISVKRKPSLTREKDAWMHRSIVLLKSNILKK